MHHIDAKKMYWEKARWKLYKNGTSYVEQILEATPNTQELYSHLPPISKTIQVRQARYARHCWRSKDKHKWHSSMNPYTWICQCWLISKNLLRQLCGDTGRILEDLLEVIDDWHGQRKKVSEIHASSVTWWY